MVKASAAVQRPGKSQERTMPHVIVKLWPGKSEQQKKRLADEIAKDVMSVLNYGEESVSVAIEEIEAKDWAEEVYKPDIQDKPETLYKKPGYSM
jgi:4-oxalocrotonate tautomerase